MSIKNLKKTYISPLRPEEQSLLPELAKYIKLGSTHERKVTNKQIQDAFPELTGKDARRRIQVMISELRITGKLKNLLASGSGYYVSGKKADKDKYKATLQRRINSLKEVYESIV